MSNNKIIAVVEDRLVQKLGVMEDAVVPANLLVEVEGSPRG